MSASWLRDPHVPDFNVLSEDEKAQAVFEAQDALAAFLAELGLGPMPWLSAEFILKLFSQRHTLVWLDEILPGLMKRGLTEDQAYTVRRLISDRFAGATSRKRTLWFKAANPRPVFRVGELVDLVLPIQPECRYPSKITGVDCESYVYLVETAREAFRPRNSEDEPEIRFSRLRVPWENANMHFLRIPECQDALACRPD